MDHGAMAFIKFIKGFPKYESYLSACAGSNSAGVVSCSPPRRLRLDVGRGPEFKLDPALGKTELCGFRFGREPPPELLGRDRRLGFLDL